MFETMAEIEASCGRLAARRLIPEDEAALREALAACKRAADAGDTEAYYQENYVFHTVVYRACRNAFLGEQARQLSRRLAPFRRLQLRVRQRLAQSLAEHAEIVEAIASGDEVRAAEVAAHHVVVSGRPLLRPRGEYALDQRGRVRRTSGRSIPKACSASMLVQLVAATLEVVGQKPSRPQDGGWACNHGSAQ